nr:PREDICTED: protein cramped-like isoform X1 [Lepisosteus oculatus]
MSCGLEERRRAPAPERAGEREADSRRRSPPLALEYAQNKQLLSSKNLGPMVRRKKTAPASEEHQNGVTAKPAEGSGDDGVRRWGRKLDRCEAEESEVSSAERDGGELLTPAAAGPSTSAPVPSSSPSALPAPGSTPLHQPTSSPNLPSQDQHHFLRSSVRPPSKRLRKDAVASAVNGHSGAKGKGAENGALVPVGCGPSGSPVGSGGATSKSAPRSLGPNDKEEGSQKKARRQWESWSAEDKNSFFEGLYEHGKDFEAIQNNIALKYKKKGKPASMVKNKEQVRHFYYRTWHKISKYIDFNNVYSRGLMKSSQELYGLICYAELRKKVGGCMDDKNAAKLNELIQHGATTVRYKGRNLRIKAPMCRALKKLCDPDGVSDEEDQKPVRLPLKVPVELQPRSNHSWARVQSLAHNPRLRMVVELHRKVSSLIEFLKQKWAVQDHRIRKSLEERQALDGAPRSPSSEEREELFLYPSESSTLTALPGVARVVHSKAFCTVHWLESGKCRPGNKELPAAQILGIQGAPRGPGRQGRTAGEPRRGESSAAEGADEVPQAGAEERSQEPPNPPSGQEGEGPGEGEQSARGEGSGPGEGTGKEDALSQEQLGDHGEVEMDSDEPPVSEPLAPHEGHSRGAALPGNGLCAGERPSASTDPPDPSGYGMSAAATDRGEERNVAAGSQEQGAPEGPATAEPPTEEVCTKEDEPAEEGCPEPGGGGAKEEAGRPPQQIREEGWSARGTENVTLAELYLMLGKPGKLQLEYEWLPVSRGDGGPRPSPRAPSTHRVLRCLLRLVSSEVNPKPAPELCSTATSPIKPAAEDPSLTPPGKIVSLGVRSPSCSRNQAAAARVGKMLSPTAGSSGARNLPRTLLIPGPAGARGGEAEGGLFAIPTTLPPNSRHGKMFSPNKEAELAFRQQLDSISMQSDIFLPKQRKFRNRHLRKPLVVQRTLLPRTAGDTSQHVCSFSILSNSSATGTGSFRPIQSPLSSAPGSRPAISEAIPAPSSSQLSSTIDLAAKSAGIIPDSPAQVLQGPKVVTAGSSMSSDTVSLATEKGILSQTPSISPTEASLQNGPLPSPSAGPDSLLSPPNMSSLLDISLPGPPEDVLSQGEPTTHISDSIIELAISSAQYGDGSSLSPAKLNGSDSSKSLPSPASSPHRNWIASPTHDPQWYPSDSTDSSLGCLLSSLISPEKGRKVLLTPSGPSSGTSLLGPSLLDGSSRDSFASRALADVGEVDSQLACMMSENSVDYIARFNDLAQELSGAEPPPRPPTPPPQGGTG